MSAPAPACSACWDRRRTRCCGSCRRATSRAPRTARTPSCPLLVGGGDWVGAAHPFARHACLLRVLYVMHAAGAMLSRPGRSCRPTALFHPPCCVPAGKPVIVAVGGGLPGTGYTLIADESVGADLWRIMTAQVGGGGGGGGGGRGARAPPWSGRRRRLHGRQQSGAARCSSAGGGAVPF